MESVECCTNDDKLVRKYLNDPSCFPILLGPDDPNYDPRSSECLTFTRAAADFQIPDDCYGQQKSADQVVDCRKLSDDNCYLIDGFIE